MAVVNLNETTDQERELYEWSKNITNQKLTEKDFVCKDDLEWFEASQEYLLLQVKINALLERQNKARDVLIKLSDGKNCVGYGLKIKKYIRMGNIDYQKIPQIKGIDLNLYRKGDTECFKITMI